MCGLGVFLHPGAEGARAQEAGRLSAAPIPIVEFTLENGLRVIVSEDHSAPIVAVNVWFGVGSAHEPEGRHGFAHLFEHLMFEETEGLGPGEMDRRVRRAGGLYNGTTNTDRTAYYEVLPSDQVHLAFTLHRERMARLLVTERGLASQRNIVREERAQRVEGQPYAIAQITLDTLSSDYAPFAHPSIGSLEDLEEATIADARSFYESFYGPDNATLVVVGDVTVDQIRGLAGEYLADIPPRGAIGPLPEPPPIPRTDGERRADVTDPLARLPLVYVGYSAPGLGSRDVPALTLLSSILTDGESSRLHRRLVVDDAVSVAVVGGPNLRAGPGFVFVGAVPAPGRSPEEVEAAMLSEIADLLAGELSDAELQRARNRLLTERVRNRLGVEGKANAIQVQAFYFGDPDGINSDLSEIAALTREDVLGVARRYLVAANRTVVTARPATATGAGR